MLGMSELKSEFAITETTVECPVLGCGTIVERRRDGDGKPPLAFHCNTCDILIYPSTFEHVTDTDNLLWKAQPDVSLLRNIKEYKAEKHRFGRENSEDAVTWNVFRHFDRSNLRSSLLSHLTGKEGTDDCEVLFWSYSQLAREPWQPLVEARLEFGEATTLEDAKNGRSKVSEPDVMLLTADELILVEAKFGSGNKTPPNLADAETRIARPKRYLIGGNTWYTEVFESTFEVVMRDQKYELLRLWLLGSWIANRLGKRFVLANLVRRGKETDIEEKFGMHIRQTDRRRFVRWEWESLGPFLERLKDDESLQLLAYLKNKTIGFGEDGRLPVARPKKAFRFD